MTELKLIDIGVNLTDPIFRGIYRGKRKHEDDFELMLERSRTAGVRSMIITGGSLQDSKDALYIARSHDLYCTAGCHPTRSNEFDQHKGGSDIYYQELDSLIEGNLHGKGRVVAVGECGLDYDRTHFALEDVQQKYFRLQLSLAKKHHLPLFLHSRAAHRDFVTILREEGFDKDGGKAVGGKGGVVHSFTGTAEEAMELMNMGFHIGLNGCSLKTEENLRTVERIPLNRIMLETDAPWCSMTSTHASKRHLDALPNTLRSMYFPQASKPESFISGKMVKGRNEPNAIGGVAWVVARVHKESTDEAVISMAWKNTVETFNLLEL